MLALQAVRSPALCHLCCVQRRALSAEATPQGAAGALRTLKAANGRTTRPVMQVCSWHLCLARRCVGCGPACSLGARLGTWDGSCHDPCVATGLPSYLACLPNPLPCVQGKGSDEAATTTGTVTPRSVGTGATQSGKSSAGGLGSPGGSEGGGADLGDNGGSAGGGGSGGSAGTKRRRGGTAGGAGVSRQVIYLASSFGQDWQPSSCGSRRSQRWSSKLASSALPTCSLACVSYGQQSFTSASE